VPLTPLLPGQQRWGAPPKPAHRWMVGRGEQSDHISSSPRPRCTPLPCEDTSRFVLRRRSRRASTASWDTCKPTQGSCPLRFQPGAQQGQLSHPRVNTLLTELQTFSTCTPLPAPLYIIRARIWPSWWLAGRAGRKTQPTLLPPVDVCPFSSLCGPVPTMSLSWSSKETPGSSLLPAPSQLLPLNHQEKQKLPQELHSPQIKLDSGRENR